MKANIDPRMHTTEHILNQTMIRMFNTGRCFNAHIEKKKSKCDYRFNRPLTADEIINLERAVNDIIQSNSPVTFDTLPSEQARKIYNSHTPEGFDSIRIVKVGDYDAIPCIGNHVKTTGEIGQFKIISSDYNDGVLRIRYKLN